jgi:hypothetical protein
MVCPRTDPVSLRSYTSTSLAAAMPQMLYRRLCWMARNCLDMARSLVPGRIWDRTRIDHRTPTRNIGCGSHDRMVPGFCVHTLDGWLATWLVAVMDWRERRRGEKAG